MSARGQTHRLGREAIHTAWDNALPPRLTIAPGDVVVFDTLDASYGNVARAVAAEAPAGLDPDLAATIAAGAYPADPAHTRGHPLTGPVAVAGAEPGDTLAVEIAEIVTAPWGWTGCRPGGIGLLDDEITTGDRFYWDLRDGRTAPFGPGIRVPLAPFPGVIGVAPAEPGRQPTAPPRNAGGNMDIRQLTAGATLYLPVLVPGALFSVGDVHAAQGDGEVTGTGIETEATVTLRFDLLKGRSIRQPQFRTALDAHAPAGPFYATTGHDPDLREAAREALRGMLDFLMREYGLPRTRAYILASACVDLKISQIVDAPNWTVSAFFPLSVVTG
ncbi:MAG TPA: acetamidase/formamidase family protein [Thermomicrobiales bacterium]|nr:acetamidase/formamidase family protein [Thermomicrobiales bacterium]